MIKDNETYKWIKLQEPKSNVPFVKAKLISVKEKTFNVVRIDNNQTVEVNKQDCLDFSGISNIDDMCNMTVLNQPQILNNIKSRFTQRQIFTQIGDTLLVVNPYQTISEQFNQNVLQQYKNRALGNNKDDSQPSPHIYNLAGRTYTQFLKTNKKQTIIISGESGAGKTQSTKFCLQLLTSLSHSSHHSIQQKILNCNPILEAFGNSKTVRNDNSSRFGKYVQVFFDQKKNIVGSKIKSYLLEKSRVVELQKDQRNYHCFYALVAGKLKKNSQPKDFNYLKNSNCFVSKNINDEENFQTICNAMKIIGFSDREIDKIWQILKCILEIGNLQIDDSQNQKDDSQPCSLKNRNILESISKILGKKVQEIEKFFIYERRKFLKEYLLTPYNMQGCRANMDSLSKQLYSKTFDFILEKINEKLQPQSSQNHLSHTINILDIFGFENFEKNSLQQICINFTNEKLLNLYNRYIFEKELQILREDGLQKQFSELNFPNNQGILNLMHSKKVSIFSIVNDLTPHQQYKDVDILMGVKKQMGKNQLVTFPQNASNSFIIKHSQCPVNYKIQGFKSKNKDKIKQQITQMTQSIFQFSQKPHNMKSILPPYMASSHHKQSKTLLSKFTSQIQVLMSQLQSSNVHFVRCLKPNNDKKPFHVDENYLLNQIRYLGVFQTIKIRKSVFPCRKTYEQFKQYFDELFSKDTTIETLLKKFDKNQTHFMLGKKRVYLSPSLQQSLLSLLQKIRKIKIQCAKRIFKQYKAYRFRKVVLKNLKVLKEKIRFLAKISAKDYKFNLKIVLSKLWKNCIELRQKQLRRKELKQKQENENKHKIKAEILRKRSDKIKQKLPKVVQLIQKMIRSVHSQQFFKNLTEISEYKIKLLNKGKKDIGDQKLRQKKQNLQVNGLPQQIAEGQKIHKIQKQLIDNIKNSSIEKENYKSVYPSEYASTLSIVDQNQRPYYQQIESFKQGQQFNYKKNKQTKTFMFPQQFTNYNSVVRSQQSILFRYNLHVDLFDYKTGNQKLKQLKLLKKKQEPKQKQDLKDSQYVNFSSKYLDRKTYQKIISFSQQDFSEKYLRKRSKLMGKAKSFSQIFKAKRKPLQKSISKLSKQHEQFALKIFKQILKIYNDSTQQFILIIIEVFISLVSQTTQQIVNETFVQLLKQIHSDREDDTIKAYKLILAFLHFFRPQPEFLLLGLYIFFQKLQCNMFTENQQSYLRLVFHKTYNKSIKKTNTKYIPSKFQLYCLICKKLFPFNFYLPMGSCVQYNVESDQTFADIKCEILQKFGVNIQRINPKYFAFFQIVTFEEGQMQQMPISDDDLVWDVKSYWQIAINRYNEHNIAPPKFYFLLKLKFPFELHSFDYEGIELMYSECYFDYFTGKIRVPQSQLMEIGSLILRIKKITIQELHKRYVFAVFPLWAIRKYGDQTLFESLKQYLSSHSYKQIQNDEDESEEFRKKFEVIRIFQKFPLAMSIAIPPEIDLLTNSSLLCYLKPRRLYVVQKDNMQILQEYELKKIVYWQVDQEKLSFQVKEDVNHKSKTHVFYTEYAQLFSDYLKEIGQLMRKGK